MSKKLYIETYGCQMNVADSELVASILDDEQYKLTDNYKEADLVLINTCAIRDGAEARIYGRVGIYKHLKKTNPNLKLGVIGCMAQRMKKTLLEKDKTIDFIAGPDSYKRLPQLLDRVGDGERPLDVILSKKETYDDLKPLHYATNKISGFVSISRGCDNMCAFCIVPFTRGRERSRSPKGIMREIKQLQNEGFKEVTLLGQNVDKYNFNNGEVDFANLLEMVAKEFPTMRIRFSTSYPQHMKNEVLHVIANNDNVCKYIHLPVQSGSNSILEKMKRGYTREWYLNRIKAIKEIIPEAIISTDIIVGFCDETEQDHKDTLKLMEEVGFAYAYMFKYSERPNTFAARKLKDNVPENIKSERLSEIIELQAKLSFESNKLDFGKTFEVLVEGISRKSEKQVHGRNSQNKVFIFDGDKSMIGKIIKVKVTKYTQATLFGKIV